MMSCVSLVGMTVDELRRLVKDASALADEKALQEKEREVMRVTGTVPSCNGSGVYCRDDKGLYWYSNYTGAWINTECMQYGDNAYLKTVLDASLCVFTFKDFATFQREYTGGKEKTWKI